MKQYKSSSELKIAALEKLNGKYGTSMLVTPIVPVTLGFFTMFPLFMIIIMFYVIIMAINGVETIGESIIPLTVILTIVTLICQILIGVFKAGIVLYFLNIACGKRHSVSNIFFGFRWQFKKSLAYSTITILLTNLCTLPYQFFVILYEIDPQMKWEIYSLVSLVIAWIIYMPIQLSLSQYLFLMLDFPHNSVRELLKLSMRVMKGQKKKLFLLQLSFIPFELLSILSFGIGYLWLSPFMMMTNTLFFLDIMQTSSEGDCCKKAN